MALASALFAGAGVGVSLLQYGANKKAIERNIARERKAAEYRAQDRRQALRETLAAGRVMAIAQGSDPDVGSNVNTQDISLQNFMSDVERDAFQTSAEIGNLQAAKTTNFLNTLAGTSRSLLSYAESNRQATGASRPRRQYNPSDPRNIGT